MAETGVGPGSDLANPKKFYVTVWELLRSIESEIKQLGHGLWAGLNEGVEEQYMWSNTFVGTPTDVFPLAFAVFEEVVESLIRDEPVADQENILLSVLAICLRQALRVTSPKCKNLMETLANASRLRTSHLTRITLRRLLIEGSQMAKAVWDSRSTSV